ncbi:macrolide export protein MacA [mine drainage metagenome]|uniref:Macrolide export protein MacA n=1 Tax=mine drainage metagenome TaxID=410659 RepID=A0A1J5SAZ6_9ZZZZ
MKLSSRKTIYWLAAIASLALIALLFRPEPLRVDTGQVQKGGMQVTVDEQGETRAHDRFVVTAPVAGRLTRIELHDGDAVRQNQVVAQIAPLPLSIQERREQTARIASAQARQREAEELVRHAQEDIEQARRESKRVERLVKDGFMSSQAAEQARNAEITIANEMEAARFRVKSAAAEVSLAESGLIAVQGGKGAFFKVRSPVAGRILNIPDQSERVVAAGSPLLTVGDMSKLEVVIELLSSEAVKVKPGMPVILDGWGGGPLQAKVRLVEPHAFTKVSALGVEEKRTNVVADFVDVPQSLGDGYRVNAHIVVWTAEAVTKVPASALFRCADAWCAFVVEKGVAKRRVVTIGQRNSQEAEALAGLDPGEVVVRHPANQIDEGVRVKLN